ncbi:tail fiber assembly [Enterobacter phage Arya]|uniref:Glycine-rich domain-containing protein n=1 Tax=Enterobacter phage Arya TaxID=1864622 RepID=A0A193GYN3_9CAUD|nr:tail fiber assembly [Enterobacter phage Arya]ANN86126.1 hypothetical protein BI096_gp18 [Enterobacter phage Arya]
MSRVLDLIRALKADPTTNIVTATVSPVNHPDTKQMVTGEAAKGRLIGVRVFSTPGVSTYTPTPGTKAVLVEVQGGGGGGGGTGTTGSGSFAAGGSGGAGGGYAASYLTSGFSNIGVTVGAGGGVAANSAGATGGTSAFGALINCAGGAGGTLGTSVSTTNGMLAIGGATGGTATGGNIINEQGGHGMCAFVNTSPLSGSGGSSHFGSGAYYASGTSGGRPATNPGSGGSGACSLQSNPSGITGGNGAPGIVIIWEYA